MEPIDSRRTSGECAGSGYLSLSLAVAKTETRDSGVHEIGGLCFLVFMRVLTIALFVIHVKVFGVNIKAGVASSFAIRRF